MKSAVVASKGIVFALCGCECAVPRSPVSLMDTRLPLLILSTSRRNDASCCWMPGASSSARISRNWHGLPLSVAHTMRWRNASVPVNVCIDMAACRCAGRATGSRGRDVQAEGAKLWVLLGQCLGTPS